MKRGKGVKPILVISSNIKEGEAEKLRDFEKHQQEL